MLKRVLINGATGLMGQETVKAINSAQDFELVATACSKDNLANLIMQAKPDIVIDFTDATCAYENALTIIEKNVHPVIGTTGFKPEQIEYLRQLCAEKKLGGLIAPNFSVGAVLMMKYAADAIKYLPNAEIIEIHRESKKDSPSGTSIKTAEMMAANRQLEVLSSESQELIAGARGATLHGISIHSLRLPGYVAEQTVIFGGTGEALSIKHNSNDRKCFMPGVLLACRKVSEIKELHYGLETILD